MKGKLCVTTFVFGRGFEGFLGLYVYSILKAYSEYYPLIFLHGGLSHETRELLEPLSDLGDFKIVENHFQQHALNNQQGKAVRWLLDHPEFQQYEAVYIGDVDIFIVPEDPGIYEQHCRHCETLKLCYSNIVRPPETRTMPKGIHSIYDVWRNVGPLAGLRFLLRSSIDVKRLSGLQFVKTADYFPNMHPLLQKYRTLILENTYRSRATTRHHRDGFNNECLLYDMLAESGMGVPEPVPITDDYRDWANPGFRPYHGLHMGIFKNDRVVAANRELLDSNCYEQYYQQFRRITESDPLFHRLLAGAGPTVQNMFARMNGYYTHHD